MYTYIQEFWAFPFYRPIQASISTDNLTIVSYITLPPNLPSVLSLDVNTYEGAAGELAIDYIHMIRNNNQTKYKYKARINKGEKCPDEFEGSSGKGAP